MIVTDWESSEFQLRVLPRDLPPGSDYDDKKRRLDVNFIPLISLILISCILVCLAIVLIKPVKRCSQNY